MKRVIRKEIFESNSSMSHSVVIMTAEKSKKWEELDLYYYNQSEYYDPFKDILEDMRPIGGELYTEDEVLKFLELCDCHYDPKGWEDDGGLNQFIRECDYGFISYDMWSDNEYLETDSTTYTTPGGEKIVVYCKYGADY